MPKGSRCIPRFTSAHRGAARPRPRRCQSPARSHRRGLSCARLPLASPHPRNGGCRTRFVSPALQPPAQHPPQLSRPRLRASRQTLLPASGVSIRWGDEQHGHPCLRSAGCGVGSPGRGWGYAGSPPAPIPLHPCGRGGGSSAPALPPPRRRSSGAEGSGDGILLPLRFRGTNLRFSSAPARPPSLARAGGVQDRGAAGGSCRLPRPCVAGTGAKRGPCPFCPSAPPPLIFSAEVVSASLSAVVISMLPLVHFPPPSQPWPLALRTLIAGLDVWLWLRRKLSQRQGGGSERGRFCCGLWADWKRQSAIRGRRISS